MYTGDNEREINEIPNDQYACTKCNLVPEIIKINYDLNTIEIKCPEHGKQELNIKEYFNQQKEHIYYSIKCNYTSLEQRTFIHKNEYFSHCFGCGKNLCLNCVKKHSCNKLSLMKVNEINDKCREHLKNYNKYCITCNKNCCEKCDCKHKDIKRIEKANKEDIEKIKKTKAQLIQNIENQKYFIKFLDTILETYEKHSTNYYNTMNISNVANNIANNIANNVEINQNEIIIDKLNTLQKKVLNYLNAKLKLKIKLDGKEKIIKLDNKNIGTVELELLTGIKFENLEELYLNNNNIEDIGSLKDLYSPNLRKIDLSYNNIHSIKPLKDNILEPKLFKYIMEIKLDNNKDILMKDIEDIKNLIRGTNDKECELIYKLNKNMEKIRIVGNTFFINNKAHCKMKIGKEEEKLSEYYDKNEHEKNEHKKNEHEKNEQNNTINITLIFDGNIKDITGIFTECENLISINSIFTINPQNITDLSDLFSGCILLQHLPNSLSEWDTSKVTNMNGIFYGCKSLENLPDISKWDTSNVKSMLSMFNGCSSLLELPDISKWNISRTENISCMFINCSSLRSIPKKISSWKTGNVTNMGDMFNGCSKIKDLSFLENWNTSNVTNMKNMFKGCTSLSKKPNIEKWDKSKVKDKKDMFKNCPP